MCAWFLKMAQSSKGGASGFRNQWLEKWYTTRGWWALLRALTDPSQKGQILVLTYPLIDNYGVLANLEAQCLDPDFESGTIQIQGLVVSDYSCEYSHWNGARSLDAWLRDHQVLGLLYGVDTRRLTKRLRHHGSMLGKILNWDDDLEFYDPNRENLVDRVSLSEKGPISLIPEGVGVGAIERGQVRI